MDQLPSLGIEHSRLGGTNAFPFFDGFSQRAVYRFGKGCVVLLTGTSRKQTALVPDEFAQGSCQRTHCTLSLQISFPRSPAKSQTRVRARTICIGYRYRAAAEPVRSLSSRFSPLHNSLAQMSSAITLGLGAIKPLMLLGTAKQRP